MSFTLPHLKYSYSDLEPYIDAETMNIHHTKHHQGYVDGLNKTISDSSQYRENSLEEILMTLGHLRESGKIDEKVQKLVNFAGGHSNHTLYWENMTPNKVNPNKSTQEILDSSFGGLEKFIEDFSTNALSLFGSGWGWFVYSKEKSSFELTQTKNQDSPIMFDQIPILGIDVWEHAYYLKYQNKRADYINAWWNIVNWSNVDKIIKSL